MLRAGVWQLRRVCRSGSCVSRRGDPHIGARHLPRDMAAAVRFTMLARAHGYNIQWLCVTNKGVDRVNQQCLLLQGVTSEMLETGFPGDPKVVASKIYVKVGLIVRLTRNLDKDRGFVNGATGEIVTILQPLDLSPPEPRFIVKLSTGTLVLVHPIVDGGQCFLPCTYGYASTIRRAQGHGWSSRGSCAGPACSRDRHCGGHDLPPSYCLRVDGGAQGVRPLWNPQQADPMRFIPRARRCPATDPMPGPPVGATLDAGVLYFDHCYPPERGYGYVGCSRFKTKGGAWYYGRMRRSDWIPILRHPDEQLKRSVESMSSDSEHEVVYVCLQNVAFHIITSVPEL